MNVVESLDAPSSYRDSRSRASHQSYTTALSTTSTLYLGNLSFYTTEEQIYELFSRVSLPGQGGGIRRVIMGLDRVQKTPCGFAFVEFYTHQEALLSLRHISSTKLDERLIRCDLDPGYTEGRQYGRGKSGGQVRDEHRMEYDAGRGGWGAGRLREEEERQRREAEEKKRRQGQEQLYRQAEQEAQGAGQTGATIPGGAEAEYFDESENRGDITFSGGGVGDESRVGKRARHDDDDEDESGKRGRRDDDDDDDEQLDGDDDDDIYGDLKRRKQDDQ
ncbi:unnamed protein product [Sympodiomycopsis kandeliae]